MSQPLNKNVDEFTRADWDGIAQSPKFRELSRRKFSFLVGWWLVSTIFYFILPVAAGYTTGQSDFFNTQIIGHIPLLYLFSWHSTRCACLLPSTTPTGLARKPISSLWNY